MKLKITVDGKVYEVDVEVSEPEPPQPGLRPARRARPASRAAAPAARPGVRPRPSRPGGRREQGLPQPHSRAWSSSISAQVGQTIQVNDVLLVLEAMKMETVITAPIAGKVAKINVNVGDAVQAGTGPRRVRVTHDRGTDQTEAQLIGQDP